MLTMIETVIGEFGQTLRRLGREWGFVTAFVVTLALGIGANGAIFTALNAYLLRPLPYPQAGQLGNVYLGSHAFSLPEGLTSAAFSKAIAKSPSIAASGLYQGGISAGGAVDFDGTATVILSGQPRSIGTLNVTAGLFKALGVQPLLGHWIDSASNRPDGPREVVVSYRFWQGALGGKSDVIGQPLKLDGRQYTVVGVMPRGFVFPNRSIRLWRSVVLTPKELSLAGFTQFNWNMIVRRAPGVSRSALHTVLNAQLERIAQRVSKEYPTALAGFKPYVGMIPLRQWLGGATGGRLLLLQLGAVLLLILAAANLGNLALVRTLRRRHELGLRLALGASRIGLLRLTLTETLPLGVAAAIVGWILSRVGAEALAHFGIASGQTAFALGAGGTVGAYGVLLSLIVAFIALSAPLFLVRSRHLTVLLQSGGRGAAGGRGSRRTRKGLSVAQIALAVMLLSASALVGLSLHRMLRQDPGFNPDRLTVASLNLTGPNYKSYAQVAAAWRAAKTAVAKLPGIRSVGVGDGVPFTGTGSFNSFHAASKGVQGQNLGVTASILSSDASLPKTLGLRLLYGRLLTAADVQSDAHVVVIGATLADGIFDTANVVGRRVQSNGIDWRIVGVVAPIKDQFGNGSGNSRDRMIVPASKTAYFMWNSSPQIVIRSSLPTRTVVRELKAALAQALPGQAITHVSSMRGLIAASAQGTSALATLLIVFGILAFVLASVGTYGVVAYLTRLRRREFAIRLVLGARPWQIEWLVLAQGVALWAGGAVLGIGFAILFGRLLGGQLHGVSLFSPAAYIVPALVLGVVVALASWLPARRVRRTALAETLNPQ